MFHESERTRRRDVSERREKKGMREGSERERGEELGENWE